MNGLSTGFLQRNIGTRFFRLSSSPSTLYYRRTRASDPVHLPSTVSITYLNTLSFIEPFFASVGEIPPRPSFFSSSAFVIRHFSTNSTCSPSTGTCSTCEIPCWSCGSCINKASLVCGSCAYIQPLKTDANYFDVLQIKQTFDIDLAQLDANYKRLQRVAHPDLHTARSPQEREASETASSSLNIAHKVLKNPGTRAQYLLILNGYDALGEQVGTEGVNPMLLMQVMEARELISDSTTSLGDLLILRQRNQKAIQQCIHDLSHEFLQKNYSQAKAITVALQYYTKIEDEISERIELEQSSTDGSNDGSRKADGSSVNTNSSLSKPCEKRGECAIPRKK